jgi:hypothetical protein
MTALTPRHARSAIRHTLLQRVCFSLPLLLGVTAAVVATPASAVAQSAAPATSDDPFVDGSWQLELSGHAVLETWNYNISHEEMFGISVGATYAVRDGLTLTAGAPLSYVSQRGVDGWQLGATFGIRARVFRWRATSMFLGFEVGVSEADTLVPPRGTRFNYLAIGSAGATVRVRRGIHVFAALKWIHVSNNGLAGRNRNPDIEAVGPQVGVLIGF